MKKNKKGFTLAEVLITLTIIGVVAALTAPALVKNTGYARSVHHWQNSRTRLRLLQKL